MSGIWSTTDHVDLLKAIRKLHPESGFVLCPGLNFSKFSSDIEYSKTLRKWSLPFSRYDSQQCLLFHKPSHVRTTSKSTTDQAITPSMCLWCRRLVVVLRQIKEHHQQLPHTVKDSWTSVSSNYRTSYLHKEQKAKRHSSYMSETEKLFLSLFKLIVAMM